MNKRIKKKRALANRVDFLMSVVVKQGAAIVALETVNHLQHEHIESLGNQVAELKRLVKQNTVATNNELESLDGKVKDLQAKTTKKSFWKK